MKKLQNLISLLLVAVMLTGMLPVNAIEIPESDENLTNTLIERPENDAQALELTEDVSGTCGENLTWTLTTDGTLTISGEGAMEDYSYNSPASWNEHCNEITELVIQPGVTSIGNHVFSGCETLETIAYAGNQAQWDEIEIGAGNESINDSDFIIADVLMGDVTGDGKINVGDAVKLLKAIASKTTGDFSAGAFTAADVTRDGKINVGDAVKLLKAIASKTTDEL